MNDRTWQQLDDLGFADVLATGDTTPREVAELVRNFGATWIRHRLPPPGLEPALVRGADQ